MSPAAEPTRRQRPSGELAGRLSAPTVEPTRRVAPDALEVAPTDRVAPVEPPQRRIANVDATTVRTAVEAPAQDEPPPAWTQLVPVVVTRAAAAILIVYGYLYGLWSQINGEQSLLLDAAREWVNRPLGIGEDFGPLGIMLLLLASGYHAQARKETKPREYGIRLARTYLPVLVAVALAALLLALGAKIWASPDAQVTAASVFGNLTLANQLTIGATVLVPLAWIAVLELLCWATAVSPRGLPWLPPAVQLTAIAVLVIVGADNPSFGALAVVLSFWPLAVIGQLIWLTRQNEINTWVGVPLGLAAIALIVVAEKEHPSIAGWWYPVVALYAGMAFGVAVLYSGWIAETIAVNPVAIWLASRAVWLAVLSGVIGFPLLTLMHDTIPLFLAVPIAIAAVAAVADLGYRLAWLGDRPSKGEDE
ncbi:hypothetical protein EV193_10528 [Herbihabitans rhizosphaerae]|uniref:Peptidoglycan/LPS O-acetylase OafA/YrhL n=1 Tax=Herbihabitans rhizosphaerae TaxID=1872711 RepID=A0A4V2ESG3_9PSEU|nr:hypothetical protein EV193_10528 [Herbihabitans rhizosphaerae]